MPIYFLGSEPTFTPMVTHYIPDFNKFIVQTSDNALMDNVLINSDFGDINEKIDNNLFDEFTNGKYVEIQSTNGEYSGRGQIQWFSDFESLIDMEDLSIRL